MTPFIESYYANEREALKLVPFLTSEDCILCRQMAAEEHGISDDEAKELLRAHLNEKLGMAG